MQSWYKIKKETSSVALGHMKKFTQPERCLEIHHMQEESEPLTKEPAYVFLPSPTND